MENIFQIIDNFKNLKVLIIGDLMLDQYIYGNVSRISPEAPIPVLEMEKVYYTPGGAANVAFNAKNLGAKVILSGVVGLGQRGAILKRVLENRNIDTEGIIAEDKRKTTLKERVIAGSQQIVRIDLEDRKPITTDTEKRLIDFIKRKIKDLDAIIISDYAKGVITPNLSMNIIGLARENNVVCHIDPKGRDYFKYRNCHIITPNQKELAEALNLSIDNESRFIEAGKMLLSHIGSDKVIVTRHEKGMVAFDKQGEYFYFPAINKSSVVDVSGAGDTGIAAITLALVSGANLKQAMEIASHACGVVVGKFGTATTTSEEVKKSINNFNGFEKNQKSE